MSCVALTVGVVVVCMDMSGSISFTLEGTRSLMAGVEVMDVGSAGCVMSIT